MYTNVHSCIIHNRQNVETTQCLPTDEWKVKVTQSCPTLCDPMDYTVHGILQARILEWVAVPSSRGSSQPGIEPRSPTLQADSLAAEPQEKPKNTGVSSLSLLQRIFLIQESNRDLLHCRRILYQLSCEGRVRHSVPVICHYNYLWSDVISDIT